MRDVLVATDDERIFSLCESFGAQAVMTSPRHLSGTDRIAEVAEGLTDDFVVNIQGDEPLIEPRVIDAAIEAQPQAADDVRGGKDAAIGRLVGAVMKASGGQADAKEVRDRLFARLRG